MKVKIRGLVFAGFAAAVFAQSAMAVAPTQPKATEQATDEKTVTSKYYVDGKFNGDVGYVLTQGSTRGSVAFKQLDDEGDSIDTENPNNGTNIVVTGKAVANAINGLTADLNITGDPTKHTDRVAVYQSGHENDPAYITGYKIIVPDDQVAESGTDIGTNIGTINQSGPASGHGSDFTTAQAVYDFVTGDANNGGFQPKTHVDSTNGEANNSLKFGMGEGKWGVVRAYGQTSPDQTANSYLQIVSESERDTYSIGIDPSKVASHGASGGSGNNVYSNQILSGSASLATANAVYEYAVPYQWDSSTQASKTLVTDSTGRVTVSTVPTLPEFGDTDPCKAAGVHCALVTNYDTQSGISFEWTVMAQGS